MPYSCLVLALLLVLSPAADGREIEFVTQQLPWAVIQRSYVTPPLEVRVSGMCPFGGVGYTLVGGALPPGVQLSRLGYFSGVPSRTGSFEFNVRVSNGCSWSAKRLTITVAEPPTIQVDPPRLIFDANSPPEQDIHVSAAWPKLPYQVSGNADWLKLKPEHGFAPDDVVHVRIDAPQFKPGHYAATLTFSAWQASGSPAVSVDLDVK
jgi:hypothetical protein